MGKLKGRITLGAAADAHKNRRTGRRSLQGRSRRPPVGVNMHTAASSEAGPLGGFVSTQAMPPGSILPHAYVIALSQTDTIEQARWMHALDTRRTRRSSGG
jgi:hypothetical protein